MTNLTGRKIVLRKADPDGVTTGVFLEFSHLEYTPHVPNPYFTGMSFDCHAPQAMAYKGASAIIQLDDASSTIVNIPIADFSFNPIIQATS